MFWDMTLENFAKHHIHYHQPEFLTSETDEAFIQKYPECPLSSFQRKMLLISLIRELKKINCIVPYKKDTHSRQIWQYTGGLLHG